VRETRLRFTSYKRFDSTTLAYMLQVTVQNSWQHLSTVLQCVAVYCSSVLQCIIASCCSVLLQRVAVRCSVLLQRFVVYCCSVLQCIVAEHFIKCTDNPVGSISSVCCSRVPCVAALLQLEMSQSQVRYWLAKMHRVP